VSYLNGGISLEHFYSLGRVRQSMAVGSFAAVVLGDRLSSAESKPVKGSQEVNL
jgi:hypothetical protein